jgi:threonine dehydrogenase-like Zn-dependent dehydrogenase
MEMVATGRMDLTPLVTHAFELDDIKHAYELFSRQGDGVLKVALFPQGVPAKSKGLTRVASAVPG